MSVPSLGEQYSDLEKQESTLTLGMWVFLGSELLLFAALFTLYAAYRAMYGAEFRAGIHHNTLLQGTLNMYILLCSSFTVALSVWAARRGRPRWIAGFLAITIALGVAFLAIKVWEYAIHWREGALPGPFYHLAELRTFGANRFFTIYWMTTGVHALHVTAGVLVLIWMLGRSLRGHYTPVAHARLEMGTLYWHLVDVIWIFLWPLLYLA